MLILCADCYALYIEEKITQYMIIPKSLDPLDNVQITECILGARMPFTICCLSIDFQAHV